MPWNGNILKNFEAGGAMPGGFGASKPKRRGGSKNILNEIRQLSDPPHSESQEPKPDVAMQAEIEAFFARYQEEHPEELEMAWSIGVYNPLAEVDLLAVGARFPEAEEEDWLALARILGWVLVEDDMDAIYFTAPPPEFDLNQADWYVRPDATTILEAPIRLSEVMHLHPILPERVQEAIAQKVQQLGWTAEQRARFVVESFEKSEAELDEGEWKLLLFELQSLVKGVS
ncbi:MAG TPA: hypothetical protein V6C78_08965 [Crinalium sp.]|jgi:hypothetical protein